MILFLVTLGDAAFIIRLLAAIEQNKNHLPMFRGYQIDIKVRKLVAGNAKSSKLSGKMNNDPDFNNSNTGSWWDNTTPRQ